MNLCNDIKKICDMTSYSQAQQDIFILLLNNNITNGCYVEIGTNHPILINNTYLLYKNYNWTGILVEYVHTYEEMYKHTRQKDTYMIGDARNINYLELFKNANLPPNINYLQIDLDVDNRSTLDVLELFDEKIFDVYKFATVTFEHDIYRGDYYDTRTKSREIFLKRGYKLLCPDVSVNNTDGIECIFEDWYVHPDLINKNILEKLPDIYQSDNNHKIINKIIHDIY